MASHTSRIVPAFDFTEATNLPISERFRVCLERARRLVDENGYQRLSDYPCVPNEGATESELNELEAMLEVPVPSEYRQFLSICRYLTIDDTRDIGGFDHDGVHRGALLWTSDSHRPGVKYLVFGNYWRYADGDDLMIDLTEPTMPVIASLHEHGPLFEFFAASFSLALWRLVHEDFE